MKKQEKKIKVNLTKAETLEFLHKKLKKSTIEPLMFFSIKEWKNKNKEITNKIIKIFKNHRVIVRSSAIGEDSSETSEAGNYESIQNVLTKPNELKEAIKKVIKYEKINADSKFFSSWEHGFRAFLELAWFREFYRLPKVQPGYMELS